MMNKSIYLLLASAILTVSCQRSQNVPLQTGLQSPGQLRSGNVLRSQSDRGLAQMGKEVRSLMFSYFDKNKDQFLVLSEIGEGGQTYLQAWDKNQDGRLNSVEFEAGASSSNLPIMSQSYLREMARSQWSAINFQNKVSLNQQEFIGNSVIAAQKPWGAVPPGNSYGDGYSSSGSGYGDGYAPPGSGYAPPGYGLSEDALRLVKLSAGATFAMGDTNFDGTLTFGEFEDATLRNTLVGLTQMISN